MFIISTSGIFVYMFSKYKEHSRISLLSSMAFESVIRWTEFRTLYVCGNCW
jgi:hypothetical protein